MAHPWEAEVSLAPQVALELIREQCLIPKASKIAVLGAGWDNTAFLIDDQWIFRFPRRQIAVGLIEREYCILPKIAPCLPLAIPFPTMRGKPTERFPWPFTGYQKLLGTTACHVSLTDIERTALARPLAHFLRALHSTPKTVGESCKLSSNPFTGVNQEKLQAGTRLNLEQLLELGLLEDTTVFYQLLDSVPRYELSNRTVICHGDCYVRHLLLNDRKELSGVIDWGDVHLGDPAIDLAIAHSLLPAQAHPLFRQTYGEISDDTWGLARLRALYSSTMLAIYGHHAGDVVIAREGYRTMELLAKQLQQGI